MLATPPQAQAESRDYIAIVGSSTVYPFATVVAERFGRLGRFKTPKIESTGTGGGMKLFCGGIGPAHPDITNASRAIKASEFALCQNNGVKDILELKIGYDGIVLANSKKSPVMKISRKDLYLATAKEVPNPKGEGLIANPYHKWSQINPALANIKIEILGPPPTSGTRDAFEELVMEAGAKDIPQMAALAHTDKGRFRRLSHTIREDGAYIEAGENDNLIIQKLRNNPGAFGIFGFSYLDQNRDKIHGSVIDGVAPRFENIASGAYKVARPLFLYIKKAHLDTIAGMRQFLKEFTSERAWGDEGYLADRGLIPMPDKEREINGDIDHLKPLVLPR